MTTSSLFIAFSILLGQQASAFTTQPFSTRNVARNFEIPKYGTPQHISLNLSPSNSKRKSALFVSTEIDDPAMKAIEKKLEAIAKDKERAAAKLTQVEQKFQSLQKKKQEYLDGMKLGIPAEKNFSETTMRSAVKAFMWRIIAGSVTFFTSLRFSGSIAASLKIVGSDFFSKSLTMFVGERLMNKSAAGRKGGADDVGRSLMKALVWRLFAIVNTLTMSWVIAKDFSMASKIAGSDAIFKTGLMFFYERVWAKIEWGKEYNIEFSI